MKNSKLFKSLSVLALAGIMAFSSVSLVSAEETQITDKPSFDTSFDNEVGVKYLSEKDTIAVVENMWGKSISEMTSLAIGKYGTVHIVDENTTFSIDWDKSAYSKKDVIGMYINTYLWYRDENGTLQYAKGYPDNGEEPNENDYFRIGYKLSLLENAKSELNLYDNFYYSLNDFGVDGGNKELINSDSDFDGTLDNIAGGRLCYDSNWPCMYLVSDINNVMNSSDTTSWKKPQSIFQGENSDRRLDSYFNNNMFLATICIEYKNSETGEVHTSWEYIASKSALTSEKNPFNYLNEIPSDKPSTGDSDNKPSTGDNGNKPSTGDNEETTADNEETGTTTEVKEVTLTLDNAVISKDDMSILITENATKDIVVKTPAGITLTFSKGTMKAVDGKDTYDFGVSVSNDYSKHSDMGVVTKDNFVSLIDFNYSGNLPAEATVKIPVGVDRAGQTLYYSQKVEAGYTLVQSAKVDDEGYITVKQDHCSTYVVTTTDVSKDNSADVPAGPNETPDTGDTNNVIIYIALFVVAGAMLVVLAGSKMRKRA